MVPSTLYWKDLAERVVSSFLAGVVVVVPLDGLNILHADWKTALISGASMAVVAVIKGLVAKFVGNKDSASLTPNV